MTNRNSIMLSSVVLSCAEINNRIRREICYETLSKLSDANLMTEYKQCDSVKNKISCLENIIAPHVTEDAKQKILGDYLLHLIPPGTKGVVKGNTFNTIVKNKINDFKLDDSRFEICFEKKCVHFETSEIPDWYIYDRETQKVIVGMNQLDLWSGGHQLNRGSKYLEGGGVLSASKKLLCVVCNSIQFKTTQMNSKAFKLIKLGFENDTLCYLNQLESNISAYFMIENAADSTASTPH